MLQTGRLLIQHNENAASAANENRSDYAADGLIAISSQPFRFQPEGRLFFPGGVFVRSAER